MFRKDGLPWNINLEPIKRMLKLVPLLGALCLPLAVHADSADTLVDLVRPHARAVQTLTFLSKINPFGPASPAAKECDMSRVLGTLRTLYAQQYRQGLSPSERASAIEFFGSERGQSAVRHRFERDGRAMNAAVAKQTVKEEELDYPKPLADAMGVFLKTSAGLNFVDDRVEKRTEPEAGAIERVRTEALNECVAASRGSAGQVAQARERPAQRSRGQFDPVRFVLETDPSADQSGFSVDIYPNAPTCETQPVPAVRQLFSGGDRPAAHEIEVDALKPLSFSARATYASGGSCGPGAMTFVPQPGDVYIARLLNQGNRCWVELSAREPDGRVRRVPVEPKPLKVDSGGRHSCDWVVQ
jgi:hypothetical protein